MEPAPNFPAQPLKDRLEQAVAEAARSEGPDTVALMRVLIEAPDEASARDALVRRIAVHQATGDRAGVERLLRLQDLWHSQPQAWQVVHNTISGITHDRVDPSPDGTLRYWADAFDRLAAASPEASVALYSLGSPDLLRAATDEIVQLLQSWDLIGPDRDAVDLGCGIGRFLESLAPLCRSLVGLDISERMVAEAGRRCRSLGNISVATTDGHDLAALADGSADFVLAADVFPYLVQAGGSLPERHIAEFARILRPGGAALILNYSYRGDNDRDRRELAAHSAASGLRVVRNGVSTLTLWDGVAFHLAKPAASEAGDRMLC